MGGCWLRDELAQVLGSNDTITVTLDSLPRQINVNELGSISYWLAILNCRLKTILPLSVLAFSELHWQDSAQCVVQSTLAASDNNELKQEKAEKIEEKEKYYELGASRSKCEQETLCQTSTWGEVAIYALLLRNSVSSYLPCSILFIRMIGHTSLPGASVPSNAGWKACECDPSSISKWKNFKRPSVCPFKKNVPFRWLLLGVRRNRHSWPVINIFSLSLSLNLFLLCMILCTLY